jgi:hypothetical protein
VVVCEGFHDRAFLKGWLESCGYRSPEQHQLRTFVDRRGKAAGGQWILFKDPTVGPFVRLIPCSGDSGVWENAKNLWATRSPNHPIDRLVVCVDSDSDIFEDDVTAQDRQAFEQHFGQVGLVQPDGARADLLCWHAPGATSAPGLPTKHTLELLVCEAMRRAHPERATTVATFMDSPPPASEPSSGTVKEHVWAYMAKWYGHCGCDEFYQRVWREPELQRELSALLRWFLPGW